jgi:hypothetical protein
MKNNCTIRFVLCDAGSSVTKLKWHTNVKEAIAIGNKEHKPLMMFSVVIGGMHQMPSVWTGKHISLLVELDIRRTRSEVKAK